MRDEASKYSNLKLIVRDGKDDIHKQIADVQDFIKMKVDAILISPKTAKEPAAVINKAYDAKIPVIVLDRDITNDRYTQFIGGDNRKIGRAAGTYIVTLLGGKGKARGKLLEIWGGKRSTPAQDRHNGFFEIIQQEPGIQLLDEGKDGDWKQDKAYEIMANAIDQFPKIEVVFAHNDPMAFGAYLAAKDMGIHQSIRFFGIDGIPMEGVRWVHDGILTATFLYKTPGDEGIRQAMRILNGKSVPKRISLPTMTIDKTNARNILINNGLLKK
ncbi:MAG: Periplasmic binding protein/LacI transcriptional regulator [Candidatus Magnetoglobus multicellularis str. Araruama]|uniref:Periplasmic binding protein/LacI transcriptional regulator n=1 Tax=Candidatus Magnetoglobus multicellularis str. Araruama TaxID=890399 RepID=A0A1V1PDV0_9BACT|nr:MAG: Periplasmic binding protein/LacI transcriptional regulator [Candidatus Magnetoglobus multicellularis str. Araruama]